MSTTVSGGKRPFSATGGNADSPASPEGGGKGIVIPDIPEEQGSGMGECEYRNCGQTVASSVYCQGRADDIMAKTLKPHFDGRSKKVHRPMPIKPSAQPPLFK